MTSVVSGRVGAERVSYIVIVGERGPLPRVTDIQGAIGQGISQGLCCWEALHVQTFIIFNWHVMCRMHMIPFGHDITRAICRLGTLQIYRLLPAKASASA